MTMEIGIESIIDSPLGLSALENVVKTRAEALYALISRANPFFNRSAMVDSFLRSGLIDQDDLIFLWKNKVLSLEDIYESFERDTLWKLLGDAENLGEGELYIIFQRLLYRAESFPFSGELIHSWFNGYTVFDGKLQSLIAIALWRTAPELLPLQDLAGKLERIIAYQPSSHGIHRMLFLALAMAGDNPDQQEIAMDMFAQACLALYIHEKSTYDIILESIKMDDAWFETIRQIGLQKIKSGLEEVAQQILKDAANI